MSRLGEVLTPAVALPTEPSMAELGALDRVVRAHHAPATTRPWWRRGTAGLAMAFVLAGAGTAAAATGAVPMPTPVRALAHDLGLPVDSPGVHAVRQAMADLRRAEASGDPRAAAAKAAALRRAVGDLGPHEAAGLQSSAQHELDTADAAGAERQPTPPEAATTPPEAVVPPADPATTSPPSGETPTSEPATASWPVGDPEA
jgi:hypothetical protein